MPISPNFFAGSVAVFTTSFKDENGTAMTPDTLTWTLLSDGDIVNDRKEVVLTPAASVDIVLYGADLQFERQTLVIEGTYTSPLGAGLPLRQWIEFFVLRPEGIR
jgi:hypothetical protein